MDKSGTQLIGIGTDEELHYWTDDGNGIITEGSQSFKYYLHAAFFVYDKVKITNPGSLALTKVDSVTKAPLAGAEYSLYLEGSDSMPQKTGLTTNSAGKLLVTNLDVGNYYLKETKAPTGYHVDTNKLPFTIAAGATIGGGLDAVETTTEEMRVDTYGNRPTIRANQTYSATAGEEVFVAGPQGVALGNTTQSGETWYKSDASPDITLAVADTAKPVEAVEVTYAKLDEQSASVTRNFQTLADAQADVNKEKNDNNLLGTVTIAVKQTGVNSIELTHENTADPSVPPIDPPVDPPSGPPSGPPSAPPTVDFNGKKVWNDSNDKEGLRPRSIKVALYRNGGDEPYRTLTIDENDGWRYHFEELPKYANSGKAYVYTVEELNVPKGYTSSINDDGTVITNKLIPTDPSQPEEPPLPQEPIEPPAPQEPNVPGVPGEPEAPNPKPPTPEELVNIDDSGIPLDGRERSLSTVPSTKDNTPVARYGILAILGGALAVLLSKKNSPSK